MALETAIFQADPFSSHGYKDFHTSLGGVGTWSHAAAAAAAAYTGGLEKVDTDQDLDMIWNCSPNSSLPLQSFNNDPADTISSSAENFSGSNNNGYVVGGTVVSPVKSTVTTTITGRRKRRRTRSIKNKEDVENQRMTHIAVERNRRRQMNDYLSVLRSMMPSSYVQRGDQASIIGGAINFVKELEQLLQFLETQKRNQQSDSNLSTLFSDFFTFPQYSTSTQFNNSLSSEPKTLMAEKQSTAAIADVEVTMVETHASIKVLIKRHKKQLFKMVVGLHSLHLLILHLNITTVDNMVLYSFSVQVEDDSQLTSVNEISASVYEMLERIQEEAEYS
ncbi:hypothetical protein FEM48_Zijuj08G0150200 [Ziziphus jujuba var. spinosa]|uniref:BHLH domain-containing protein n=1 Tax=Ziziphus jujuba var. spinosa TaxID=714518 RepID=A0A978UZT2_ZIZJJ|nr:hypothetical protein FEM48_Zijuj08G0150200 [Ziziphus jujuba var. spinosa]